MQYVIDQHRELCFDEYMCLGHAPVPFHTAMKQEGIDFRILRDVKHFELLLAESRKRVIYIFAAGNFGGKGKLVTEWLEAKRHEPDYKVLL